MAEVYGETAEQLPDSGIFHPHDCDGNRDPRGHVDICDRLEMTPRTSEAWPLALTMGQNSSILPVLPITKELRTMPIKVRDRKSTRLNSSHSQISYAVFCLKKKKHRTVDRV